MFQHAAQSGSFLQAAFSVTHVPSSLLSSLSVLSSVPASGPSPVEVASHNSIVQSSTTSVISKMHSEQRTSAKKKIAAAVLDNAVVGLQNRHRIALHYATG